MICVNEGNPVFSFITCCSSLFYEHQSSKLFKDESCLELPFISFDTRLNVVICFVLIFVPRASVSFGHQNDILRRVALGTRKCFVLLLRLPFIQEPVVSSQVISIVQKFRILNTSLLSLSLHLTPREGHHT